MAEACGNCGENLVGAYCHGCGQRRLGEDDRRFGALMRQFFAAATDLDGRFWRSLGALVFRPGLLSRDHLAGRRQRWMSPVSLFLLANLLYFFAPGLNDFELPFGDQVPGRLSHAALEHPEQLDPGRRQAMLDYGGQFHSRWTAAWVEARVGQRDAAARAAGQSTGYSMRDYARVYNDRSADISKLLIFLHVPLLALALQLLFLRSRLYFAEHFVVATHLFTFVLLFIELVLLPIGTLVSRMGDLPALVLLKVVFPLVLVGYFALALRQVHAVAWWRAALSALLAFVALVAGSLVVYRTLQFLVIYALT